MLTYHHSLYADVCSCQAACQCVMHVGWSCIHGFLKSWSVWMMIMRRPA
jgi:hypothetical protein